ncbi:MAG: GNAT family N-acetyltransferase [Bifidobacteriaceae bacterium]|nr:GNAT family N-acetyltransferase [Bifidobacteriaceae bacterium]
MSLRPPEPIAAAHDTSGFRSGVDTLDAWLRRRALANERSGASRTFVVADGQTVVAYYSLAAACVAARDVSGRIRRNMPDPIPAVLLARLAVDSGWQGGGLARSLVRDAVLRALAASTAVGVRCLVVNALSPKAAEFWEHIGFTPAPREPLLLAIALKDAAAALDHN